MFGSPDISHETMGGLLVDEEITLDEELVDDRAKSFEEDEDGFFTSDEEMGGDEE
jgi:hypothetical protein